MLVKTDVNGIMEWNQTYQFSSSYYFTTTSVVQTSDGGYALAKGASLIKTDATGNKVWNQTFEGTERRSIISMITTSDGGYVLAGFYGNFDKPKSADFWLIKTNEHGYIPEFTSWIVLPAFLIISLSFIGYKKKLTNRL
jgi:outer membrane protein assembly factor BamB